ncbi:unnamed protein product [Merluccius merluccius]
MFSIIVAPGQEHLAEYEYVFGGRGGLGFQERTAESCLVAEPGSCKRKEQEQSKLERNQGPKRTRLVFTDLQRRTLLAIFRENHRPAKDLQITISQQLGLELSTVSNFFMNARRRNLNKWADEGRPSSTGSSGSSVSSSAVSCSTA